MKEEKIKYDLHEQIDNNNDNNEKRTRLIN